MLDIGMPGTNGYEVARRIREMKSSADAMLVAMREERAKQHVRWCAGFEALRSHCDCAAASRRAARVNTLARGDC
jgi:CheY-like chemotaxis protein